MATSYYAPDPVQSTYLLPGTNTPGAGVQVFFYAAGTSTKQNTYQDEAGLVAHTNPIVLDSGGNLPGTGSVWLTAMLAYDVVYAPANDTDPPASPYRTVQDISGINDVTAQTGIEWVPGPIPTFVGATSFTVVGDQTAIFTNARRLQSINTGGTVYSTITSVTFSLGLTTVRVVNDSGALDAGLSAVFYSLLDPANPSIDFYYVSRSGGTVTTAANGTTDIWGVSGPLIHITGTNAIFSFSSAAYAGAVRWVIADSAFPINSSVSLAIPGNGNVTTAAGDRFQVNATSATGAVIQHYQSGSSSQSLILPATSGQIFATPASSSAAPPRLRPISGIDAGITLLSAKPVSAATSNVNFTTADFDWTAFDEYWFDFMQVVPTSSNVNVQCRISADGGVTYNSSSIYTSIQQEITSATTQTLTLQTTQLLNLNNLGLANAGTDYGMNGRVEINRPSYVPRKEILWKFVFPAPSSSLTKNDGVGQVASTGAWTGIQFFCGSGNFSSGTFYAYGLRKT